MNHTITVPANGDADDCLAFAAERYIRENPELKGWDLSPAWVSDQRMCIVLTVPGWHWDAISDTSGT
jgi:hypothetical protein